jgi:hypothetical protein
MSSTTPHRSVETNVRLVIGPDPPIEIKLLSRMAERLDRAKSEADQLSAIRSFADDLETAKRAQAQLRNLAADGLCECPACSFQREIKDAISPVLARPKTLISWARVLIEFFKMGKADDAVKANRMVGNPSLTVGDYLAAGVSEADCELLLAVMPAGSFGRKPAADTVAEPAVAQEEAPPATA